HDLSLRSTVSNKFTDFIGRNAALARRVEVGSGGRQEEAVASAKDGVTGIVEQQQIVGAPGMIEARQAIPHFAKSFIPAELDAVKAASRAVLEKTLQPAHVVDRRTPNACRRIRITRSAERGVPWLSCQGGTAARNRSAAATKSCKLTVFGSNSKLNFPSLVW